MLIFVNVLEIHIKLQFPNYSTTLPFSQITPINVLWAASVPWKLSSPETDRVYQEQSWSKQFHL